MSEAKKEQTKPVPVRFDETTRARLGRAAKKLSSNRAAVVRLAVYQLLPEIEAGSITLK